LSRSVAEVFREAGRFHIARGDKRLAVFLENLPHKEDQRRFFEAARAFLSFDLKIRNLPAAKRSALVRAPIESILTELWRASYRVLREDHPGVGASELDVQLFGTRLLMARLIVGGMQGTDDKKTLLDAALLLRELSDRAREIRSESEGKRGRLDTLAGGDAQRKRLSALLRTEAEKLLKDTRLRSKRDRANVLNKRIQKLTGFAWPTRDALVEFARRNKIKI
jgi:hypothetical protein